MRNLILTIFLATAGFSAVAMFGRHVSDNPVTVEVATYNGGEYRFLIPDEASRQAFLTLFPEMEDALWEKSSILDDNPADGRYYAYLIMQGASGGTGLTVAIPLQKEVGEKGTGYLLDSEDFSGTQAAVVHTCKEKGSCNPGICNLSRTWLGKVTGCYCTSDPESDACEHSMSIEQQGIDLGTVVKAISIIASIL